MVDFQCRDWKAEELTRVVCGEGMDMLITQLLLEYEFLDTTVGEVPGASEYALLCEEAFAVSGDFDFLFPVGVFSGRQAGERAGVAGDDQAVEGFAAEDASDEVAGKVMAIGDEAGSK